MQTDVSEVRKIVNKTTVPWKIFSTSILQLSYIKMVKCNKFQKSKLQFIY